MKVKLFTLGYPFTWSAEHTFIQNEIDWLQSVGYEIEIFPYENKGEKTECLAKVNLSLATKRASYRIPYIEYGKALWFALKSKEFRSYFVKVDYRKCARFFFFQLRKVADKAVIQSLEWTDDQKTLYYSFWCTPLTLALVELFSEKNKVFTRAHGIDLFKERGQVYQRDDLLRRIDKFIVPSKFGLEYMKETFPRYEEKVCYAPIGVKIPDEKPDFVEENLIRLVSCSTVDSNKRVKELGLLIEDLAHKNASAVFEWGHFGDGPMLQEIRDYHSNRKVDNLQIRMMGHTPNEEILAYYLKTKVHLFLSLSLSEGGRPLSVQEAVSCGIPICITPNQGLKELFDPSIGICLDDPMDLDKWSEQIMQYLNKVKGSQTLQTNLNNYARMHFSLENQYNQLKMIFFPQ